MAFSSRSYARPYLNVPGLPRGIKWLLIANVAIFLLAHVPALTQMMLGLALVPASVVRRFYVWQLATYSFLHLGLWDILWNMLTLWMFGSDIEQSWGTDRFLRFYFTCAIGPALCVVLLSYIFGGTMSPTFGAWGPIYGILLVCAVLWPEREVLFIVFPMKMKYFTILIGAIALYLSLSSTNGASTFGLLTGMAFGFVFLKSPRRRKRIDVLGSLDQSYKAWKLARAKKKFQVYLKKQKSDRGPWVN